MLHNEIRTEPSTPNVEISMADSLQNFFLKNSNVLLKECAVEKIQILNNGSQTKDSDPTHIHLIVFFKLAARDGLGDLIRKQNTFWTLMTQSDFKGYEFTIFPPEDDGEKYIQVTYMTKDTPKKQSETIRNQENTTIWTATR